MFIALSLVLYLCVRDTFMLVLCRPSCWTDFISTPHQLLSATSLSSHSLSSSCFAVFSVICWDLCFCTSLSKVTWDLWRMLYLDLTVFFPSRPSMMMLLSWWLRATATMTVASLHLIGLKYVVGSSKGWSVLSAVSVLKMHSCICIMFRWALSHVIGGGIENWRPFFIKLLSFMWDTTRAVSKYSRPLLYHFFPHIV